MGLKLEFNTVFHPKMAKRKELPRIILIFEDENF